jgi:hypothetical protein
MFDRIFMPVLTFAMLVSALGAFAFDLSRDSAAPTRVVQLERVVVQAQRELPATPVARADSTPNNAAAVR